MGAEDHDIIARVTRSGATSSTGALAAHLARACGHVLVDDRVVRQGYRFHPELSDEIPAFFNRRISTGSGTVAITLQGGMDPDAGDDRLADCTSTADVRRVFESDDYHASLWRAIITIGAGMLEVADIADPLFIARHPNEFRVIAEELVALGAVQGHACPMCGEQDEDDAGEG